MYFEVWCKHVCACICSRDAHVAELLIHIRVTHVLKEPAEAVQTSCKNTRTHIQSAECDAPAVGLSGKPVSSICGWWLIPSKEVCSGRLHSGLVLWHENMRVCSIEESSQNL